MFGTTSPTRGSTPHRLSPTASTSAGNSSATPMPPQSPHPQPGPSTYSRAPKGKACLNCRRRKLKCDCARPVCSQCARYGRERDCEYSDKDQRSRTEVLEETIALLQARLSELEHHEGASSPSATLGPLHGWNGMTEDPRGLSPKGSQSPELIEPSLTESQALIDAFMPYSNDVGFFLNPTRFLAWATQRLSSRLSSHDPFSIGFFEESSPLLAAVYLWGATLADSPELRQHTHKYLAWTRRLLSTALCSEPHRPRSDVLHVIQAEVLLSTYLFNEGLFAEGRQHTASAASLVLSYGLHKIPASPFLDPSQIHLVPTAETELSLSPSIDPIEEGERICGFWEVYILDKTWSAVLCRPSLLVESASAASTVDTPWPLTTEQYAEGMIPHDYGMNGKTVQRFMSDMPAFQVGPHISARALRAQAAALLDRSVWLSSALSTGLTFRNFHDPTFANTDAFLNKFILFVTSLQNIPEPRSSDWTRSLVVTQCIARLATAQLAYAFSDEDINNGAKCLNACKAIISTIQTTLPMNVKQYNPIIPVALMSAGRIMYGELARVQNPSVYHRQAIACNNPLYLAHMLGEVTDLMGHLNRESRLTALQLEVMSNLRSTLTSS